MSASFPRRFRCVVLLVAVLMTQNGCNINIKHDPDTTVIVEITGIKDKDDRDEVTKTLQGMTDGSSHLMSSSWSGENMTVKLSPVGDVKAFSRRINFGKVTEVNGRTIKVKFVK